MKKKSEEMETTTNKLKMQLKSAQSELEQTRNTLTVNTQDNLGSSQCQVKSQREWGP